MLACGPRRWKHLKSYTSCFLTCRRAYALWPLRNPYTSDQAMPAVSDCFELFRDQSTRCSGGRDRILGLLITLLASVIKALAIFSETPLTVSAMTSGSAAASAVIVLIPICVSAPARSGPMPFIPRVESSVVAAESPASATQSAAEVGMTAAISASVDGTIGCVGRGSTTSPSAAGGSHAAGELGRSG